MSNKNSTRIGFLFFLSLLVFLIGFTQLKNRERVSREIAIQFEKTPRFITKAIVNKLLTQKMQVLNNQHKDTLILNMLESDLEAIPAIQNAEVYRLPEGHWGVIIREREPFFRVAGSAHYYVDTFGVRFPRAKDYVADVPVYLGDLTETKTMEVVPLLQQLLADPFLAKELTHLSHRKDLYRIGIRSLPYDFVLGKGMNIPSKIRKLKIFCAYQRQQQKQLPYQEANLMYKNQVVVTTP